MHILLKLGLEQKFEYIFARGRKVTDLHFSFIGFSIGVRVRKVHHIDFEYLQVFIDSGIESPMFSIMEMGFQYTFGHTTYYNLMSRPGFLVLKIPELIKGLRYWKIAILVHG